MDKMQEVKEWFDVADGDLRAAEHLLTLHHPRPDNIICNLCQQAAEKHIKGFLISKRVEFRKTHDLVALLELAKTDNVDISVLLDKCALLFQYAVEARYPFYPPDICLPLFYGFFVMGKRLFFRVISSFSSA
jgi:HEPN domain-containing protein